MKKQLTYEQRLRRRAEYSVRVIALCLALMLAICVACGVFSDEVVEEPTVAEESAPEPVKIAVEQEPEPVIEDPLAKYNKIENATLTHYCVCQKCCGKTPDHPAYGITASGREAEPYTSIAVDPFVIPLGAYILIEYEDGSVLAGRADDTGSGVNGGHIDLCVSSHEEARQLGWKTVNVYWTEEAEINGD